MNLKNPSCRYCATSAHRFGAACAAIASHTVVSGREQKCGTNKVELHVFITLTHFVRRGEIRFVILVRG